MASIEPYSVPITSGMTPTTNFTLSLEREAALAAALRNLARARDEAVVASRSYAIAIARGSSPSSSTEEKGQR